MTTSPTLVEGTVEAANERGIKLNGSWLNASKFRPVDLPPVGAHVRATVDLKGFLISAEVLDSATPTVLSRNDTITRLAVLKAAAYFCGQRATVHEDVRSEHVLKIADAWLEWVQRAEPEF